MNFDFEHFNTISTFFNKKNIEAPPFNSISDPIYKQGYLESIFFAYLDYILRTQNSQHYKRFIKDFEKRLNGLKAFFKQNERIFSRISDKKFDFLKEKLLEVINSYRAVFFSKEYVIVLFSNSRQKSQVYFKVIMQILLISELDEELDIDMIKKISKYDIDEKRKEINNLIVKALKINLRVYDEDLSKSVKTYFYLKDEEIDDNISNFLNLLRDSKENYRILYEETRFSHENKQTIIKRYEHEKKIIEKNHKKEIKKLAKLYNLAYEYINAISQGMNDYMVSLMKKENKENHDNQFKKERQEIEKKILKKEKKIKKTFGLKINSKSTFIMVHKCFESVIREINDVSSQCSEDFFNIKEQNQHIDFQIKQKPCDFCNKISSNLTSLDCSCKRCEDCLVIYLNEIYEKKLGSMEFLCYNPNCKEINTKNKGLKPPYSNDLIEKYLGKKKLNEMLKLYQEKEIGSNNLVFSTILFDCPVCCEKKKIEEFITFDCDCKLCEDCCKGYLRLKADENIGFDIPCFNVQCKALPNIKGLKVPTSIVVMSRLLGQERVDQISFTLANKQAKYCCANPECRFPFDLNENNKINFFFCNICRKETCLLCMNYRHKEKNCDKIDEELKKYLKDNKQITRICPNPECLQPTTKDDECDHVECPYCKVSFCFRCSVIRSPTLAHGNHYHRKDCKWYQAWVDKNENDVYGDRFMKNCEECKKIGKLCKRPNQTIREFYKEKNAEEYLDMVEEDNEEHRKMKKKSQMFRK